MSEAYEELSRAELDKLFTDRTYIERVDSKAKKWFEWLRDFVKLRIGKSCVVTRGRYWSFPIHPRNHRERGGFYILNAQIKDKSMQLSIRAYFQGWPSLDADTGKRTPKHWARLEELIGDLEAIIGPLVKKDGTPDHIMPDLLPRLKKLGFDDGKSKFEGWIDDVLAEYNGGAGLSA